MTISSAAQEALGALTRDFNKPDDALRRERMNAVKRLRLPHIPDGFGVAFVGGTLSLTHIFPDATKIGNRCFNSNALINIDLPTTIETIGDEFATDTSEGRQELMLRRQHQAETAKLGAAMSARINAGFLKQLDLTKHTKLCHIGDDFLRGSAVASVALPPSIISIGNGFLAHTTTRKPLVVDLSCCQSLEDIGTGFGEASTVQKVVMAPSIDTINDDFLADAKLVSEVTLGPRVSTILSNFAVRAASLKSLDLSVCALQSIGPNFLRGSGVAVLKLPSTITLIGHGFVAECRDLKDVDLSSCVGLRDIGDDFALQSGVSTVKVPDNVETIGAGFFAKARSLQDLDLSSIKGSPSLGTGFLQDCGVKSFRPPKGLTTTPAYFCKGAFALSELDLSLCKDLNGVGANFCADSAIVTLKLPEHVENFDTGFCARCWKMREVDLSKLTSRRRVTFGDDFLKGCTVLTSFTAPSVQLNIGSSFLAKALSLEEINLASCRNLVIADRFVAGAGVKRIVLPTSLQRIGAEFAAETPSLDTLDLSACTSLKSIGDNCLKGSNVLRVLLPTQQTVQSASRTRNNVNGATAVPSAAGKGHAGSPFAGPSASPRPPSALALVRSSSPSSPILHAPKGPAPVTTILKPKLTQIDDGFCCGVKKLNEIVFSPTITQIGDEFCSTAGADLATVDLSGLSKLRSIGSRFLHSAAGVASVKLPKSIAEIGDEFCAACTKLKDIDLEACSTLARVGERFAEKSGVEVARLPGGLRSLGAKVCEGCAAGSLNRIGLVTLRAYVDSLNVNRSRAQEEELVKSLIKVLQTPEYLRTVAQRILERGDVTLFLSVFDPTSEATAQKLRNVGGTRHHLPPLPPGSFITIDTGAPDYALTLCHWATILFPDLIKKMQLTTEIVAAQTARGYSVLHYAIMHKCDSLTIAALLKATSPTIARHIGAGYYSRIAFTPLHLALAYRHFEAAQMLLEKGGGYRADPTEAITDRAYVPFEVDAYDLALLEWGRAREAENQARKLKEAEVEEWKTGPPALASACVALAAAVQAFESLENIQKLPQGRLAVSTSSGSGRSSDGDAAARAKEIAGDMDADDWNDDDVIPAMQADDDGAPFDNEMAFPVAAADASSDVLLNTAGFSRLVRQFAAGGGAGGSDVGGSLPFGDEGSVLGAGSHQPTELQLGDNGSVPTTSFAAANWMDAVHPTLAATLRNRAAVNAMADDDAMITLVPQPSVVVTDDAVRGVDGTGVMQRRGVNDDARPSVRLNRKLALELAVAQSLALRPDQSVRIDADALQALTSGEDDDDDAADDQAAKSEHELSKSLLSNASVEQQHRGAFRSLPHRVLKVLNDGRSSAQPFLRAGAFRYRMIVTASVVAKAAATVAARAEMLTEVGVRPSSAAATRTALQEVKKLSAATLTIATNYSRRIAERRADGDPQAIPKAEAHTLSENALVIMNELDEARDADTLTGVVERLCIDGVALSLAHASTAQLTEKRLRRFDSRHHTAHVGGHHHADEVSAAPLAPPSTIEEAIASLVTAAEKLASLAHHASTVAENNVEYNLEETIDEARVCQGIVVSLMEAGEYSDKVVSKFEHTVPVTSVCSSFAFFAMFILYILSSPLIFDVPQPNVLGMTVEMAAKSCVVQLNGGSALYDALRFGTFTCSLNTTEAVISSFIVDPNDPTRRITFFTNYTANQFSQMPTLSTGFASVWALRFATVVSYQGLSNTTYTYWIASELQPSWSTTYKYWGDRSRNESRTFTTALNTRTYRHRIMPANFGAAWWPWMVALWIVAGVCGLATLYDTFDVVRMALRSLDPLNFPGRPVQLIAPSLGNISFSAALLVVEALAVGYGYYWSIQFAKIARETTGYATWDVGEHYTRAATSAKFLTGLCAIPGLAFARRVPKPNQFHVTNAVAAAFTLIYATAILETAPVYRLDDYSSLVTPDFLFSANVVEPFSLLLGFGLALFARRNDPIADVSRQWHYSLLSLRRGEHAARWAAMAKEVEEADSERRKLLRAQAQVSPSRTVVHTITMEELLRQQKERDTRLEPFGDDAPPSSATLAPNTSAETAPPPPLGPREPSLVSVFEHSANVAAAASVPVEDDDDVGHEMRKQNAVVIALLAASAALQRRVPYQAWLILQRATIFIACLAQVSLYAALIYVFIAPALIDTPYGAAENPVAMNKLLPSLGVPARQLT